MRAALIAVGSELLLPGGRKDTNSDWLTAALASLGFAVIARVIVGDDVLAITATVRQTLERAEAVLLTGGLGPTEDDRTREALAESLGVPLERDPECVADLQRRFAAAGRTFTVEQARQADRPLGFSFIDNANGTAPGLVVEHAGVLLAALPGVPVEMRAMFERRLRPLLAARHGQRFETRSLRIAGRGESEVDRRVRDLYDTPGLAVTILSGQGVVELLARADAAPDPAAAADRLDGFEQAVRRRLGGDVFGTGEDTLASVVGNLLSGSGRTLATAESCTGGLLGASLTEVPGASVWYSGGAIVYADPLKREFAGVREETLARHGAVSEAVARELARGARERCGSDLAVATTGIAGPGGGRADKPVGTVHIGLQDGSTSLHWELRLLGDRSAIRKRAVVETLDRLRRRLLETR